MAAPAADFLERLMLLIEERESLADSPSDAYVWCDDLRKLWASPTTTVRKRPEVCPECAEVVCDADCRLAAANGWPTEATRSDA